MGQFLTVLLVGAGGFLGSNARYWLGEWLQSRWGMPWHTLAINVSGSLLLGLFMGLFLGHEWKAGWRSFVAIGVLGGYTTFSTFAWETVKLIDEGEAAKALGYAAASVALTIFAAWMGLAVARFALGR